MREEFSIVNQWTKRHPFTIALSGLLLFGYTIQVGATVYFEFTLDEVYYWFYATPNPSPSWILAPFSHDLRNPLHVIANVGGIIVFGGYAESYFGKRETAIMTVLIGYISVYSQIAYGELILSQSFTNAGFSGAVMGLMGAFSIHIILQGEREMLPTKIQESPTVVWTTIYIFSVILLLVLPLYFVLQLTSIIQSGNSAVVTHFSGFLMGLIWRSIRYFQGK